MAVIDSLKDEWAQQPYGRFGEWLLPELVFDSWPIMKWNGQILSYPERPRHSFQDGHRVRLIEYLKIKLMPSKFITTTNPRQSMESCLGPGAAVRLPLPQAIRRSNRMASESKKTSGDSGGDDD
jgi:hypothetical protein